MKVKTDGMTYHDAWYLSFAAALNRLYREGRMSSTVNNTNYTDPETGERRTGYNVTPLRLEWD